MSEGYLFDDKCPICGEYSYFHRTDLSTQEFYGFCSTCGYLEEINLKRDEDGKVICGENGKPLYQYHEKGGYGWLFIKGEPDKSCIFDHFLTEEEAEKLWKESGAIHSKEASLTIREEGTNKIRCLYENRKKG